MQLFNRFQPPKYNQIKPNKILQNDIYNNSYSGNSSNSTYGSNNNVFVNNNSNSSQQNHNSHFNPIRHRFPANDKGQNLGYQITDRSFEKKSLKFQNQNRNVSFNNSSNTNTNNYNRNHFIPPATIVPQNNSFRSINQYQTTKINKTFQTTGQKPLTPRFQSPRQDTGQKLGDLKFIVSAMNNSYTHKISGGQNVKMFDMMELVGKTVQNMNRFSMLKQGKIQDLKYYYKIVQIDQFQLFQYEISLSVSSLCSQIHDNRQKYQLLISLDGKQLRFQSLKNRSFHFNINFDTIYCQFNDYNQNIKNIFYKYRFKAAHKQIQLFVTQNSLPFTFSIQNVNSSTNDQFKQNSEEYIFRSAREISKVLRKAIQKSRGYQFKLLDLLERDAKYFTNNYATEEQFTQYCQTGDVLLFKDNHTFAKIQRAVTNSQYDHIAFVYRSDKYGICLVESSSGLGVGLTVWTHLIRHHWFRHIESISWRRLLIHEKDKDFQNRVTTFVNQNLHKKYGISISKLFRFQSKIESQQEQKNRTYFCSQLVAHLYKHLGLIDPTVSSSQYWPKHFSSKGYISMLNNSALDHQRILMFNQNILKQNYQGYK